MIGKVATPIPTKLEVENATTIKLDQKPCKNTRQTHHNARRQLQKQRQTPVGQMEVFLDLDDDNDSYGVGSLDYVGQLVNLDINKD